VANGAVGATETVLLHHIFPHYHINGMIFGESLVEHKIYVLAFPTLVYNISRSKKK
jgi:hypothetical protein